MQAKSQREADSPGSAAKTSQAPEVDIDSADQPGPASLEPPLRTGADFLEQTPEELAEETALLLAASSLSTEQRRRWEMLSAAVAAAAPPPGETRTGPPLPEVLEALRIARRERDAFAAGLSPTQKEEVGQLFRLEKRARKLRGKEDDANFRAQGSSDGVRPNQAESTADVAAKRQKEVMTKAFWLFQQDRQREAGSKHVDSTEWKYFRALGGDSPVLRRYLERAGWERSWPPPEPEGRLLRREGQQAALARYARK